MNVTEDVNLFNLNQNIIKLTGNKVVKFNATMKINQRIHKTIKTTYIIFWSLLKIFILN